jgi:hypothetical protein
MGFREARTRDRRNFSTSLSIHPDAASPTFIGLGKVPFADFMYMDDLLNPVFAITCRSRKILIANAPRCEAVSEAICQPRSRAKPQRNWATVPTSRDAERFCRLPVAGRSLNAPIQCAHTPLVAAAFSFVSVPKEVDVPHFTTASRCKATRIVLL